MAIYRASAETVVEVREDGRVIVSAHGRDLGHGYFYNVNPAHPNTTGGGVVGLAFARPPGPGEHSLHWTFIEQDSERECVRALHAHLRPIAVVEDVWSHS